MRIPQPNPFGNRAYRRSKAGKERIAFILENATLVNDDGSDVEAE